MSRELSGVTGTSVICAASSAVRPGRSAPPEMSTLSATLPLPPNVPPRTSIELACEPTTESLPARTVLSPCQVFAPARNSVPPPRFVRLPS